MMRTTMLSMEGSRDFDNLDLGPDPFEPDNNCYQREPGVLSTPMAPRSLAELTKLASRLSECKDADNANGLHVITIRTVRRELENWHNAFLLRNPTDEKALHAAQWARFHESGIAHAILSLALDERIYDLKKVHAELYFHEVYRSAFLCLCGYPRAAQFSHGFGAPNYSDTAGYLKKINELFSKLWAQEKTLLAQVLNFYRETDPDSSPFDRLLELIFVAREAHRVCFGHAPKLTDGHICHIALYVWTSTLIPDTNNFSWELFTPGLKKIANGTDLKTSSDDPDVEDARQFLEQAIIRPNRQEHLIDQFHCTVIMYEYLDGALAEFLKICHTMLDLCPQILQSCSNYTRGRLRDACSIACQRTLCSGGMKDDTFVYEVTELSMDLMSQTWVDLFDASAKGRATKDLIEEFFAEAFRYKILPLFERIINLPAIKDRATPNLIASILRIVILYQEAVDTYREQTSAEDGFQANSTLVKNAIDSVRSVWYPTLLLLETLGGLSSPAQSTWISLLSAWEELGRACGLSSVGSDADVDSDREVLDPKPWGCLPHLYSTFYPWYGEPRRGCFWRKCPCAAGPTHRLKVCKRCWRVLYCSTRCQAHQDWKEHRSVCRRPERGAR